MFKKLKLLFIYIRILKRNKELLKQKHDISIDWVWRMYTKYQIPIDQMDDIKQYGPQYVNTLLKKEITKIDNTFISIGLSEYIGLMEAVELPNRKIGIAFRFKYLDTAKITNRIIWSTLYGIGGGIGFYLGCYMGLGIGFMSVVLLYWITRIFT